MLLNIPFASRSIDRQVNTKNATNHLCVKYQCLVSLKYIEAQIFIRKGVGDKVALVRDGQFFDSNMVLYYTRSNCRTTNRVSKL